MSFISIKMLMMKWVHIPVAGSLAGVLGALGVSIAISLLYNRKKQG